MREQVLKALANPARIFYVPYTLAVINFAVQFIIYIILFIISLVATGDSLNPMWFLGSLCGVHMILAFFSKKEPQLGQIISAKIQLLRQKIPDRLIG